MIRDIKRDVPRLDENRKEKYADDIRYINRFLAAHGLQVKGSVAEMFYNHIFALLSRMEQKDFTKVADEESAMAEIEDRWIELAQEMAKPLFAKRQLEPDRSEILFLATYFGLLQEKNSGGGSLYGNEKTSGCYWTENGGREEDC